MLSGSYVLGIVIRNQIQELLVEIIHGYVQVIGLNHAGH